MEAANAVYKVNDWVTTVLDPSSDPGKCRGETFRIVGVDKEHEYPYGGLLSGYRYRDSELRPATRNEITQAGGLPKKHRCRNT